MNQLHTYFWPGNIRELRNIIERLIVLHDGKEIREVNILQLLPSQKSVHHTERSLTDEKKNLEKTRIIQALEDTYGNKSIAAKKLGMSRAKKLKEYWITY